MKKTFSKCLFTMRMMTWSSEQWAHSLRPVICPEGLHSIVWKLRAGTLQPDLLIMAQPYQWVTLGKSPKSFVSQFPHL